MNAAMNIRATYDEENFLNNTKLYCIYIYIYICSIMNTTILQLVAIYNVQLHVSALYVGYHQVVQRTY